MVFGTIMKIYLQNIQVNGYKKLEVCIFTNL